MLNVDLPAKFQEITYKDAMLKYGSDKPDLRVTLELVELTSDMKDVDFKVFLTLPIQIMVESLR